MSDGRAVELPDDGQENEAPDLWDHEGAGMPRLYLQNGLYDSEVSQWNFGGRFVKMLEVRQTISRLFCFVTGV